MKNVARWDLAPDETALASAIDLTDARARQRYAKEVRALGPDQIVDLVKMRVLGFLKAPVIMDDSYHGTVLEIGCGQGVLSACLSKLPGVEKVIALDYSSVYLEKVVPFTISQVGGNEAIIERVHGSFNAMELDDASVDFVVSTGTLHHSEDLAATARECYRVLKPGGWCVHHDSIFGSTSWRFDKSGLRKPLSKKKLIQKYGDAYADETITSEMLSSHWLHLCDIEYHFLRAKFQNHSIPLIKNSSGPVRAIAYLTFKLFGNFLLQHRHMFPSAVPIYPWFMHDNLWRVNAYKNLLFICQKPGADKPEPAEKGRAAVSPLKQLLHYFLVGNRRLERAFRRDLETMLAGVGNERPAREEA